MVENGTKLTIRDAQIVLRNLAGEPDDYNPKGGKRTFGLLLPDQLAEEMLADEWNVKYFKAREDDEDQYRQPWLPVEARYDFRPPRVFLVTERGKTLLREEEIGRVDQVDIEKVDLVVTARHWEVNEKSGVKAYLTSMYVTINEDELDREYADIPEQ